MLFMDLLLVAHNNNIGASEEISASMKKLVRIQKTFFRSFLELQKNLNPIILIH